MNKKLKIIIPIAIVIVLASVISIALVSASRTRVAFLDIDSGQVQVDSGSGWTEASDGMELEEDDRVRTLEGRAIVIIYESIFVELEPNTEISIAELAREHAKVRQESGTTWNKFTAIAGVQQYDVETPTTVATVRGTSFWVGVDEVGVSEGSVDVKTLDKELRVEAGRKEVKGVLSELTAEEKQRIIAQKERMIRYLKTLRQDEINKHPVALGIVKSMYRLNDENITIGLAKIDAGTLDINTLKARSPLRLASLDKIELISDEIRKEIRIQRQLNESLNQEITSARSENSARPTDGSQI